MWVLKYFDMTRMVLIRSKVQEVSHDARMAKLVRVDVNWTTRPRFVILTSHTDTIFGLTLFSTLEISRKASANIA